MTTPGRTDPVALVFAAPVVSPGESWRERSLASWRILAGHEGLVAEVTDEGGRGFPGTWCGNVVVEGVIYRVHRAPRLRMALMDADGRPTWALHAATYVEPVLRGADVVDPRDDLRYPDGYPDLDPAEGFDLTRLDMAEPDHAEVAPSDMGPEPTR